MKNRILKHLASAFYLFYILSALGLAGTITSAILNFIIGWDPTAELKFDLISSNIELPIKFTLTGGEEFNGIGRVDVQPVFFEVSGIGYRLLSVFNQIVLFICAVLITRQCNDIFQYLSKCESRKDFFIPVNYIKIRKIGFIALAYILYTFSVSVLFASFILDDLQIMDQSIRIFPNILLVLEIIPVLIIFVIAEVYKAGIQLKEETELTI